MRAHFTSPRCEARKRVITYLVANIATAPSVYGLLAYADHSEHPLIVALSAADALRKAPSAVPLRRRNRHNERVF
jgi:hypothetical protein